jgi:hypothetical protein
MSKRPVVGSKPIFHRLFPSVFAGVVLLLAALSCSPAIAQTTSTLVPSSYVTTSGTSGGQPVASSIDLLDESGTTNTWTKYVEFQTTSSASYAGYQVFTLPTTITPSSVTAIQVKVNYQGPDTGTETWTWQLYNWSTASFVTVGTNAGAPSWGAWTILTFNASGTLANYVRTSDGQMRVQLVSNNNADNTDIDYEAVVVTSGAQTVSVSVSPTSASVQTGATQQFTATVTGSSNTAVNWQVNGVAGGNSTVGTISTSGLYTAPATVPSPAAVTVKAISQADTTKSASATVTVTAPAVVSVSVSPTSASVQTGATQQFTATVTGSSNTAVNWQVNGVAGGNSTVGTISMSGLYTAPAAVPSPSTVTVTAVSQADTTKSASATVTVTAPAVAVAISPTSASVQTTFTQQFTATVTGTTNTAVTWQVNGVVGGNSTVGTVTANGLYAAPSAVPSSATVTVTAVSQADTTKSASASVTVTAPNNNLAFYVSTNGNDANSGTITSPWRTIQHAANVALAGDNIHIRGGTYNESVTINVSGSASGGYITFQSYSGETAIVDGTGLTVSGETGLINIADHNYIKIVGLEIRNYSTSSTANVPVGIWITGADSYIQILNNHIHNIKTSASGCNANALGLAAYGTNATNAINNLIIDSNELDHLTTGCSESLTVDGNVQYWTITNNLIHDNNNIGIDAIGFEKVSSNSATDQARDGVISGNSVYNITSYGNPAYGNQYAADGIYCDGCTRVTIERNTIHNTDFALEVTSEWPGKVASYVTVRSNLVYNNNASGLTIGGYDSKRGGTDHCNFVNNSFYNNDTKNTGAGEFQIQYYATNNVFKNNIVYAGAQNVFIYSYTNSSANPVDADYNLYYSLGGATNSSWTWNATSYTGYAAYQSASGKDAHSSFSNPQYLNLTTPDLHVAAASPAVNSGTNLGTTVEGTLDYAGNARVQGTNIDIGAYEQ